MQNKTTYQLKVPIEVSSNNVVSTLEFTKPTFGGLKKIKAEDAFEKAFQMVCVCTGQPESVIERLSYDDTLEIMEKILPGFLGVETEESSQA